jgi:hypothetical protein
MEHYEDPRSKYENRLWQVLLRGESLSDQDSFDKAVPPNSSKKSIRSIHALLNAIPEINNLENEQSSESKKQYFNALDPEKKEAIWYILELARLEHDNLNFRRPPKNPWLLLLEASSQEERKDATASINQKIKLLQPLLDLFEAIQPTSIPERFLQTTRWVMAYFSDKDRESLDLALSECVRSMTGR